MNQLAVVTGATKGIGRAVAERFAQAGFDIAVCARNTNDLQQMKEEVEKKFKVKVFVKAADAADKKQVADFVQFVLMLARPVNVLVNNAGHFIPGETMQEEEGVLETMIASNVYSAYYTTRGLITNMKQNNSGHIFNMCSIASIQAYPNGGSYSLSKWALLGLTKNLREEMKPYNIKVTAIIPGAAYTDSWNESGISEDRFMKPNDIAEMVYAVSQLSPQTCVEEIILRPQLGDL